MTGQEPSLQKEKVRVYVLARELDMESKDLLDLCRRAGMDVKNQLSSLDPEQKDQIVLLVKKGPPTGTPTLPKPAAPVLPNIATPVPTLPTRHVRREAEPARPATTPAETARPAAQSLTSPAPETLHPQQPTSPAGTPLSAPPVPRPAAVANLTTAVESPPATDRPADPLAAARTGESARQTPPAGPPKLPSLTGGRVPNLGGARGESTRTPRRPPPPRVIIAAPPPLKQRLSPPAAKKEDAPAQKPIAVLPKEMLRPGTVINPAALIEGTPPGGIGAEVAEIDDELDETGKKKHKGAVPGRDKRQKERNERAKKRKGAAVAGGAEVHGSRVILREPDEELGNRPRGTRLPKMKKQRGTEPRKGKVPIDLPITVRSLSEAIGRKSVELLFKLRDHGLSPNTNLNSTLDAVMAEAIALDYGCELDVRRAPDAEGQLLADVDKPDNPEDLRPRAPVVTIMGHVDHGKTSLLDKIRQSNVVATEAGGITQVLRAWRIERHGRPITFLDTPGHEAFTKMRARGAQVTDIAVIVVAADDGVMPQTEEAVSHAKAAGVPIVVAINKVDLPNANIERTERQLFQLNLIPDTMGGDTPFVRTSAATGVGIDDLLETLSLVAEGALPNSKVLQANPNKPARGTCLEAMLSEGEGVRATLIVQDGTLHRGDVILCGATYGRVRQMYDDAGRPIQEAGPSVPVRITGLDEVPNASDTFQVVPDLTVAREIAEKRKGKQLEASRDKRAPVTLEKLTEAKIVELKIILKADFRGSIEAIRKELEKLHHEEVRIRLLHTGIGGITESDVQLALTSPEDTLVIGFNVVPDDNARALAEERSVKIRQYDIIYKLTEDLRAALEGKLKPREEVVHLGRALVREVFKISRVGTIAGCYVTQGNIKRSAKVRLIRGGVVIYPPTDRTVGLDSLKRFKEDVGEVREGFECGIKVTGYDDIKVNDVIEAYRVEQVQRTL
jgi:translation initiation factor IF-2